MFNEARKVLNEHGEVILAMESDRVYELHLDSDWDGERGTIEFTDGDGRDIVLDGGKIEGYWSHPSHRME